jgi:hypothetical protein
MPSKGEMFPPPGTFAAATAGTDPTGAATDEDEADVRTAGTQEPVLGMANAWHASAWMWR